MNDGPDEVRPYRYRKITPEQAEEIRDRWAKGAVQIDLAHEFGISHSYVNNIVHQMVRLRPRRNDR